MGVEDDGTISGAGFRHETRTDPARLAALIANRTDPSVAARVQVVSTGTKEVIVVEVPSATSVVGTADGRFTRRSLDVYGKPTCLPMRPHEVTARAGAAGALDYSRIPLPEASIGDLDAVEFDRIRKMAADGGDSALRTLSNDDILKALDLWTAPGQVTAGALLLFGTEPALARLIPTHEVAFQEMAGLDVRASSITHVPLLRAMEELSTAIGVRNPAIADAFKRAGLVDRTSRGINRVFMSQLQFGRPGPDYGRSTPFSVVARLRAGPADKALAAFIAESLQRGQEFGLEDLMALHEVRSEKRISSARASELFQVSQNEARSILNGLVERGLLEARGESKGRTYHLAASVYRRLGEPVHYVRTRGFNHLQQEQMVLAYVASHGKITRRETADLCQLDPDQASRLLGQLRDQGKLKMEGTRRSAHYVAPPE